MENCHIYLNYKNKDVIKNYCDIIKKSLEKMGYVCDYVESLKNISKKDLIVFPMGIDAFKYYWRGFRNFILWQQGATGEESYLRHRSKIRRHIINSIDVFAMKKSRFNFFVSKSLFDYYHKISRKVVIEKAYIMPCFNENNVSPYNVNKYINPSFAYVGSLDLWQFFDETCSLFSSIQKIIADASFLVLTRDIDKALSIINSHEIRNYTIKYVPKECVTQELSNISYGFVLRKNMIVNNVSTPTKISSYLSSGCIVIYSKCIFDFSSLDNTKLCSFSLDDGNTNFDALINFLKRKKDGGMIKNQIEFLFSSYYSREQHIFNIVRKLKKLWL